ncbi:porin family protein [Opacimonas viscosa]|uniref:Porin family protein n=1 Tax=Opacimonas viscosa TaxID=2961944 RepID=A0AA42BLV8_9ALTE|nr:porin family protein [Opacimonas viscosa]MCP3429190.1 porin family protein [Opacimonas viscosa]
MKRYFLLLFLFVNTSFVLAKEETQKNTDDNGSGLHFSLGLGAHSVSVGDNSYSGLATSFQVGYAFNDSIALYYENNVNIYEGESTYSEEYFGNGITGLGLTYHFSETWFLSGTAGLATDRTIVADDRLNELNATGTGFGVAIGYQTSENMSVEASYMSLTLDELETPFGDFEIDEDTGAFRLIARYTF